jgi:protein SCO1
MKLMKPVKTMKKSGRTLFFMIFTGFMFFMYSCARKPPPKQYTLTGQILGVSTERKELTIAHADVPGLMPAMTMTYPVAEARLLEGRTAGELVSATLEVDASSTGTLTTVTHTGSAPLPEGSNAAALATLMLDVGSPLPDAALIDQSNRRRSLHEWAGTPTVITFIYTKCPLANFCPLMDQNFAALQGVISRDPALRGRIKLVTISFDPESDTPEVLAAHAARLKADPAVWTFLTGDRVTIDRLAARFGVGLIRPPNDPAITHNLRTILAGADGTIARIYSGNDWTPGAVAADLRAVVRLP